MAKPRPPLPRRLDVRAGRAHLWRNGTVRVRKLRGRLNELVIYVAPLLALDLVLIKKFKGVPWEEMVASGGYDPNTLRLATHHGLGSDGNAAGNSSSLSSPPFANLSRRALPANIGTSNFLAPSVHNFTFADPLQTTRALPASAPSSRAIIIELVASLIIYDAVFFLTHLALHKIPLLYTRLHATHHTHAEIHAQVTNQLDIGERLLLILTANFALQVIGAHVLTRTLFVPLFVLFLVQNHCGLDVLSYDRILPDKWGAGPRVHAQHHRLGTTGFAPYFRWCDALYERLTGVHVEVEARRKVDAAREAALAERRGANRSSEGNYDASNHVAWGHLKHL